LSWLAQAQLAAGDIDGARRTAVRALEAARRHGERGHEAYGLALLGRVAEQGRAEDAATAREHYRAARAVAESLGMRPLLAALASCPP
jgi:hypothetical protein